MCMKLKSLSRICALLFAAIVMLHISGCAKKSAPQNNIDLNKNEETQNEPVISSSPDEEVFEEKSMHIVTYDFHNTFTPGRWRRANGCGLMCTKGFCVWSLIMRRLSKGSFAPSGATVMTGLRGLSL